MHSNVSYFIEIIILYFSLSSKLKGTTSQTLACNIGKKNLLLNVCPAIAYPVMKKDGLESLGNVDSQDGN